MPTRLLREGIISSQRVNALSPNAELFYRRLMSVVDDFGRFFASHMQLRAACYPMRLDSVKDADIANWLAECSKSNLVSVYEITGVRYLEMVDFRQQVRAKKSKFPDPQGLITLAPAREDAARTPRKNGNTFNHDALPDEWRVFCTQERPDLDPVLVFTQFGDYWRSNANQARAKKSDWLAAWRGWVRKEPLARVGRNETWRTDNDALLEKARSLGISTIGETTKNLIRLVETLLQQQPATTQ